MDSHPLKTVDNSIYSFTNNGDYNKRQENNHRNKHKLETVNCHDDLKQNTTDVINFVRNNSLNQTTHFTKHKLS